MKSFLKELYEAERFILEGKGYTNDQGKWTRYSAETVETVKRLVQFVEEGEFAAAKSMKFVARHFRQGISEMMEAWKREFSVEKSASTMRSQVSVTSRRLYDLFGKEFLQELRQDRPQRVRNTLDSLCMGNLMFQNIFIGEVQESLSQGYGGHGYSLEELRQEIRILKRLTRKNIAGYLLEADAEKLSYIKTVLDRPLVGNGKINSEKVELLGALGQLPESKKGQNGTARQAINLFSGVFLQRLKTADGEDCDSANVRKLAFFLRTAYTPRGLADFLAGFSNAELQLALDTLKKETA